MDAELNSWLTLAWNVAVIALLVFLSQTFTGLNIGLMSLDTAQLQVLIDVPNKGESALKSARYARRILPLRRKGNLLLCTILLGNTAVNALMAIILGGYAGGLIGWLLTTVIIVLMCEILPQSICTRHGLMLGSTGAPIIRLAMCLFYPITKPYALVLDRLFPQRENLLDRSQLRALVEYQKTVAPGTLSEGQAEMLIGALGFAQCTAGQVMVPLEEAFKMFLHSRLDYELIAAVVQKGFSRVPVVDTGTGQVEGILHCKDLLGERFQSIAHYARRSRDRSGSDSSTPEAALPVRNTSGDASRSWQPRTAGEILQSLRQEGRKSEVYICGKNTTLMTLLSEFKRWPHLAVVAEAEEPGEAPRTAHHIGIITLHDIFGTILQAPTGFKEQDGASKKALQQSQGTVRLFDRHSLVQMAEEAQKFGEPEAEAVRSFLVSREGAFGCDRIREEALLGLLRELKPTRPAKGELLYQRGQKADGGTLVLIGALLVASGEEKFESTIGPWSCLGMQALSPPTGSSDESPYVPDFDARVLTNGCLVLHIERKKYLAACKQNVSSDTSTSATMVHERGALAGIPVCTAQGTHESTVPLKKSTG